MTSSDFKGKGVLISMTERDLGLLRTFGQRKQNHPVRLGLAQWLASKEMKLEQESFIT